MRSFTALQMQQSSGEIHRVALTEPVLVTYHGQPRLAVLSVEEFARLKQAAGEPVPSEVRRRPRPVVQRSQVVDPLGYDVADLRASAVRMAEDVLGGEKAAARSAEIAAVERRFGLRA